jgi:hypothetical protein
MIAATVGDRELAHQFGDILHTTRSPDCAALEPGAAAEPA